MNNPFLVLRLTYGKDLVSLCKTAPFCFSSQMRELRQVTGGSMKTNQTAPIAEKETGWGELPQVMRICGYLRSKTGAILTLGKGYRIECRLGGKLIKRLPWSKSLPHQYTHRSLCMTHEGHRQMRGRNAGAMAILSDAPLMRASWSPQLLWSFLEEKSLTLSHFRFCAGGADTCSS